MKAIFVKNSTAYVVEVGYTEDQIQGSIKSHEGALHALVASEKEIKEQLLKLQSQGIHCPDLY